MGGKPILTHPAAHQPPQRPFEHLMINFIELTPAEVKKYCLVMVDMWAKWVEAIPAKKKKKKKGYSLSGC